MRIKYISSLLIPGFLVLASSALANFVGNDTSNFNPTPGGLDFVTVHGSDTLYTGLLNGGFFINDARNSLPDSWDANGNILRADDSVIFSDLNLAYGINDWWELGTSFSFLLNQTVSADHPGAQFSATGLNEIRMLSKFNLKHRNPFGMALVTSVNLSQSINNPFSGKDAGPTLNIEGVTDYSFGHALVAANLGFRIRQRGQKIENSVYNPLDDQIIASIATSYYFPDLDTKIIGEIFAAKSVNASNEIEQEHFSSELLVGAKTDVTKRAAVQYGAGARLYDGLFVPEWRIYFGANIVFDLLFKPIVEIEPEPAPVVAAAPVVQEVKVYQGFQPREIETLKAKPFDTLAQEHEFQLRTSVPSKDMMPKPPFEVIRLNNFDFEFGSSVIRPEYFPLLDKLADYLGAKPDVLKVRIEGHTDSIGTIERNRARGQSRAENVTEYLRKTGKLPPNIDIEPVGYGSDRPIADNGNFQGRKQNRRVEVRILRNIVIPGERTEKVIEEKSEPAPGN